MTYNSILQIVGIQKQIVLPHAKAVELEKILGDSNYPSDFSITLQGMTFRKGAVRFLEVNPDGGAKDDHQQDMVKFYEEERENRKKYLSWPKEKLASYTDIFGILYKVSAGEDPKADDIARAKEIQLAFFKENPRRTLCDLHLFKPIIPMRKSTMNIWESGAVKIVERAVMRDMQLAN